MSIHDNLKKTIERVRAQVESEEKDIGAIGDVSVFNSSTAIPNMKRSEYLRSATGWVYGCVNVIADEIASIDMKMLQLSRNGELTEIDDHPALDVIYRANNASTRFDLLNLTMQYLELCGEAPWFISYGKTSKKPEQIFLLRPDRLTVKPGKEGELIGGYKYQIMTDAGFQEIDLDPLEVIPLRYADPNNPIRGKGPLQAAAKTVDLDNFGEKWNSQFFQNSASPSAAFQTDKVLGKEQRIRLQKQINQKYQGIKNAHRTMLLESGLKFQQISLSQKDMDFIEQQRFSRDKILSIFRVPPTALGLTTDVTRSNAEATDYVFAKRTIKPKLIRLEEQLNEFFLPLFGGNTENLYFKFDDPVPENVDQNIAKAASGMTSGYITPNEARAMIGLDPIDGGDELRDPASFQPVLNFNQQPIKSAKKKKRQAATYNKHLYNARTRGAKDTAARVKLFEQVLEKSVTPIILNALKLKATSSQTQAFVQKSLLFSGNHEERRSEKYSFQEKQLNIADDYERSFIQKLNKVFRAQEEKIINLIDSGKTSGIRLDPDKETEKYQEELRAPFMSLMRKQAELAFQIVGVEKSLFMTEKAGGSTFLGRLGEYYDDRIIRLAPQVTRETNDKLVATLKEGGQAGESIPQLKTRVKELFDNMEGYRSERIARTETIRASNFATEEAWMESSVVEAKEWLTTKDERTDDECFAMDGKVIPLGEDYFKKGDTFEGHTLDYENITHPPLHINCRCTLIPVITTPIRQGEWKPKMTEAQANQYIKDSKIKETLYHGTTEKATQNISQNGFLLDRPGGTGSNVFDGIYLTDDRKKAADYAFSAFGSQDDVKNRASIASVKVKANKVLSVGRDELWKRFYDELGPNFSSQQAREILLKEGYDAVYVTDSVLRQNYYAVLDPKSVVVTATEKVNIKDVLR